jgi:hypothetical protein
MKFFFTLSSVALKKQQKIFAFSRSQTIQTDKLAEFPRRMRDGDFRKKLSKLLSILFYKPQ